MILNVNQEYIVLNARCKFLRWMDSIAFLIRNPQKPYDMDAQCKSTIVLEYACSQTMQQLFFGGRGAERKLSTN